MTPFTRPPGDGHGFPTSLPGQAVRPAVIPRLQILGGWSRRHGCRPRPGCGTPTSCRFMKWASCCGAEVSRRDAESRREQDRREAGNSVLLLFLCALCVSARNLFSHSQDHRLRPASCPMTTRAERQRGDPRDAQATGARAGRGAEGRGAGSGHARWEPSCTSVLRADRRSRATVLRRWSRCVPTSRMPPRRLQPGVPRDLETVCLNASARSRTPLTRAQTWPKTCTASWPGSRSTPGPFPPGSAPSSGRGAVRPPRSCSGPSCYPGGLRPGRPGLGRGCS
jgi:hypothetical protein